MFIIRLIEAIFILLTMGDTNVQKPKSYWETEKESRPPK